MIPSNVSDFGAAFIRKWEGCELQAYQDLKGIWTIGYGNTMYKNGTSVKQGDTITQLEADILFRSILSRFETSLSKLLRNDVTQSQYDALLSLCYNIGIGAFGGSTILRLINRNANDPNIRAEFMKWNRSGGKVSNGLTNRRTAEAKMYFNE